MSRARLLWGEKGWGAFLQMVLMKKGVRRRWVGKTLRGSLPDFDS